MLTKSATVCEPQFRFFAIFYTLPNNMPNFSEIAGTKRVTLKFGTQHGVLGGIIPVEESCIGE